MSPQGTTLASKPAAELMVDAYVDALLAMPLADAAPTPVVPAEPQAMPIPMDGIPMDEPRAQETAAAPEPEPEPEPEIVPPTDPLPAVDAAALEPEPAPPPAREAEPAPSSAPAADRLPPRQPMPAPSVADDEPAHASTPIAAPVGQRWLRVSVGDDRYAVELLRVQEVVRLAPVIAVRGAVPSLLGVMNLRGRVVPVHDLGRWLRRSPVQVDEERSRIVVLEHQDELVGLLVTAVTDVVTLDAPQIEPPTPGLRDRIGMGIARTPGTPPTVLLDARVVFD